MADFAHLLLAQFVTTETVNNNNKKTEAKFVLTQPC